jgi:cell division protease FtsH
VSARFNAAWLERHRVDVSTLRRTDIVGIGHVLREIDGLVARFREPERAAAMGLEPPRGILLWGDPGTGKTLSARHLAASLGAGIPFYEVSADELTPDRVRGALRHLAATHPRSVLYLDEVDTFGMFRDHDGHSPETRLLLTATLAALDGLVATDGPLVVAASNRAPRSLDPALVRPGRLGFAIEFGLPDEEEREQLLALFARPLPVAEELDWRDAAKLTRYRTPADLRGIVADAASIAFAVGHAAVGPDDVANALRRNGHVEPEPEPEIARPALRRRLAVHEAGHVAVAVTLRGPAWVHAVRIRQSDGETSLGSEGSRDDRRADDESRDSLVVAFGGIAAERAILGEPSSGGRDDIELVTGLALDRFATGVTDGRAPLDLDAFGLNLPEAIKDAAGTAVVAQVGAARERAIAIVATNVAAIGRFAEVLDAAGQLTGEGLAEAIGDAGFSGPGGGVGW